MDRRLLLGMVLTASASLGCEQLGLGDKKSSKKKKDDDDEDEDDKKKKKKKKKDEDEEDEEKSEKSEKKSEKSEKSEKPAEKPSETSALPAKYTAYKSASGGYEIMMPGTPTLKESKESDGSTTFKATAGSGDTELAVWHREIPGGGNLEAAKDSLSKSFLDVKVKPIKVADKHAGYDVSGKEPKSGLFFYDRIFSVGSRFFQLIAVGVPEPEAVAWVSSFKLTGA